MFWTEGKLDAVTDTVGKWTSGQGPVQRVTRKMGYQWWISGEGWRRSLHGTIFFNIIQFFGKLCKIIYVHAHSGGLAHTGSVGGYYCLQVSITNSWIRWLPSF